jgi:uncharacterized protein (DUF2126 family)
LGETRTGAAPAKVRQILERVNDALAETASDVRAWINGHPEFAEIGQRMLKEWKIGSAADRALT